METALKVANEAIVLLKNEKNILPVNPKKYKKIAVVGKMPMVMSVVVAVVR